ncbi:MAG TPA: endonuclease III [Candidatus Binataceae bacterium]|nr:endonuclease III [Candidatus Binataceae bacterium]
MAAVPNRAPAALTPTTIGAALKILRKQAPSWNAPIVSFIAVQSRDPFKTLIGCILSLRTKDETTAVASARLFDRAATPETILSLSPKMLEKLIYPVGFYRTKAKVIRGICRDLIDKFEGRVPDDIDALLTLKGVGRKTANLVVTEAFRKPGICVDTHVHRISNRWGLVTTKLPDKTEMALRKVLPKKHWLEYNGILVAFGQTICHPTSPWCSRCPVAHLCPRIGVARSR